MSVYEMQYLRLCESAKLPLVIFVGLGLLMISLGGIAKQGSEQSDGDQRDFHPEEIFERVGGTRSLGVLTKLSIKKDYSRSALNNRFDPLLSHLISHQPEFELWRW